MIDVKQAPEAFEAKLFLGLMLTGFAAAGLRGGILVVPCLAGIPGVLMIANAVWRRFARDPVLRALPEGLSFRGGTIISWTEINTIYDASFQRGRVRESGLVRAIGIPFHRGQTVFRLPISMWLGALHHGLVRLYVTEIPAQLARDLEALRRMSPAASAHERRTPGAEALPAATLRRHS